MAFSLSSNDPTNHSVKFLGVAVQHNINGMIILMSVKGLPKVFL